MMIFPGFVNGIPPALTLDTSTWNFCISVRFGYYVPVMEYINK